MIAMFCWLRFVLACLSRMWRGRSDRTLMNLTDQQRRSTVRKLWALKSLRASVPNCERKVATTLSRVLRIEQSAPPHVISLALDVSPYGGCLMELANARIKAGDLSAWPLVRQALWFVTIGVLGRERLYWFNRHRREFPWERYDADYIVGLWTILAGYYFQDMSIINRLVPVLVRMMRSPDCLARPGEPQPQYEQKYALARFTGLLLKQRAGINVPEFLQAGVGQTLSALDRWAQCLGNEEDQRANIHATLDWHLVESNALARQDRGVSGSVLSLITPWEIYLATPGNLEWIRQIDHHYAKIIIFPAREVPLERNKAMDVLEPFAERLLKETETYVDA
jgi:hypothetical protein